MLFCQYLETFFAQKMTPRSHFTLVGNVGLEPTRYYYQQILSLSRLPVPPIAHLEHYITKVIIML